MKRSGNIRHIKKKAGLSLFLSIVMFVGIFSSPVFGRKVKAASSNVIKNGFFAEEDLSVWSAAKGNAVITAESGEEVIYGVVKTYGKITGRTSNYECFAQDVTDVIRKNTVYDYSFYVKLDEKDYAGAPAAKRTVEISPYLTVDGKTTYSQFVSGTVTQVLEPGVWTLFTGTYEPEWNGNLEQAVIRLLEQGTNYGQGEGVMGTYYVTGVTLKERNEVTLLIDENAVNFCDAVCAQMGEDFIVGTAICNSDLRDVNEMALVTKHFNALTLGNELKPDAMFGYSNDRCPGTETVTLNGEELIVPKMDYSRAEKTLNYIYDWNQEHPEKKIRIRGHVLVWHSQTPDWWFHEDYDKKKPYADTETMNKRLEWYIKTMCEHFTGPDSKYRGMFYGWDVVNEAISDGAPRYRNDSENSKWWKVYQSNEFIINAFRYANKYMDPSVELYYNDYNECGPTKREGILQLLKDVKAAEGTRIDGMGMQGHYQTAATPSVTDFADSARAFSQVVDKIQVTEWDLGSTGAYDGTEKTRAAEFSTQAYRFKEFYEMIKTLKAEGVNFSNITFWGVVDKFSWLQTANSAGGGSDGKRKQCPLLFDDDYQIKPAFWAFADSSKLSPVPKQMNLAKVGEGGNMQASSEISFSSGSTSVTFKPAWRENFILFKLTVQDPEENADDAIELFVSVDGKDILSRKILRSEAVELFQKGYETTVRMDLENVTLKAGDTVYFDIAVTNADKTVAYSDQNLTQKEKTDYYAQAFLQDVPGKEDSDKANTAKENEKTSSETKNGNFLIVFVVIGIVIVVVAAGAGVFVSSKNKTKQTKKK